MNLDLEFLNNKYFVITASLFLGLYGYTLTRMEIPDYIRNLFSNNIFRIVWLSLLLIFNFKKAPHIAILVAMIFILTLHYLNQMETRENFAYLRSFRNQLTKRF